MESIGVLEEFSRQDERCSKIYKYILGQNPMQYEETYGERFLFWSDRMLLDLIVRKMKFYKMFALGNTISKYSAFYQYCADKGYIRFNPFEKSKCFTATYLLNEIMEAGNVPYYTKDYVEKQCGAEEQNRPYDLSVALSVYEGIPDYVSLCRIRYADVDFKHRRIRGFDGLTLSEQLMDSYREMYKMDSYGFSGSKRAFDDSEGFLIRRIPGKNGEKVSETANRQRIANHMNRLGLIRTVLYDSGLIQRICDKMGVESFVEHMIHGNDVDKVIRIEKNKELAEVLGQLGIGMSVKNFVYDYRVYAMCLKYGRLKL